MSRLYRLSYTASLGWWAFHGTYSWYTLSQFYYAYLPAHVCAPRNHLKSIAIHIHRPNLSRAFLPHTHVNSKLHIIPPFQEPPHASSRNCKHPPCHVRLRLQRKPQCPCHRNQVERIYNLPAYFLSTVGSVLIGDARQGRIHNRMCGAGWQGGAVVVECQVNRAL